MASVTIDGPTKEDIIRGGGSVDPQDSGATTITPQSGSAGADLELGMDAKSWTEKHGGWIDRNIMPFFRGTNKALAYLPDSAINATANLMGYDSPDILRRIFASNDYQAKKEIIPYLLSIGHKEYVGPKGFGEYVDAFGAGFGFTVPFMGWQSRTAQGFQKLPKLVRESTTLFGRKKGVDAVAPTVTGKVIETVSKPYVVAPATTAAIEGTMGGAAGTSFELGENVAGEGWGPWFTIPGMFTPIVIAKGIQKGLVPPTVWAGKKIVQAGKWGVNRVKEGRELATGKADLETDQTVLAKVVRSKIGNEFKDAIEANENNIVKSIEIEDQLRPYTGDDEFRFTVGEATTDLPAMRSQRHFEAVADPTLTRKINERKKSFHQALNNFIKGEFGGDLNEGMLYIYNNLSGKYIPLLTKIDDQILTNTENISQIHSGALIEKRAPLGESIQKAIKEAIENVDKEAENMATRLKINTNDEAVSSKALKASQTRLKNNTDVSSKLGEDALSYEGMPKEFKNYMAFDKPLTFQDWKTFRSQVGDAWGKAINQGNSTNIKVLSVLKKELDKMAINYGKVNKDFEKFRVWYQANRITPFENGAVHKVVSPQGDTFLLSGEKVAEEFIKNTKNARAFINLFADDPIMMENMRASVFDDMMRSGVIGRTSRTNPELKINTDKLTSYLTKNGEVLAELGLRNTEGTGLLDNNISALQALANRQNVLYNRQQSITENILYKNLFDTKSLKDGIPAYSEFTSGDDIRKFFEQIIKPGNSKLLKATVDKIYGKKNPELATAFRNVMTRTLINNTKAMENPLKMKQFINDNDSMLDMAFGSKEHTENLFHLADIFERAQLVGKPSSGSPADMNTWIDEIYKRSGTSLQGASARWIAVAEKRIGTVPALVYVMSRFANSQAQNAIKALYEKAMFNPALARALAKPMDEIGTSNKFAPSQSDMRRINYWLFNLGILPGFEDASESEAPPLKLEIEGFPMSEVIPPVEEEAVVDVAQNIPTDNRMLPNTNQNTISLPNFPKGNSIQQGIGGLAKNKVSSSDLFPFDATANLIEQRKGGAPRSVA